MKSYKLEEQRLIQEITALREKHIAWVGDVHRVLNEVQNERERQDEKFSEQNWPCGSSEVLFKEYADLAKQACDIATADGTVTWRHILLEEVWEAFSEEDEDKCRSELVQVAAVAVAAAQAIDRRRAAQAKLEEAIAEYPDEEALDEARAAQARALAKFEERE